MVGGKVKDVKDTRLVLVGVRGRGTDQTSSEGRRGMDNTFGLVFAVEESVRSS